jgi:hypothetical protein
MRILKIQMILGVLCFGSISLVQPALAKVQNVDEPSWCVDAGYGAYHTRPLSNLNVNPCDNVVVNPPQDVHPPFEWGYDPQTKNIRSLTEPYFFHNDEWQQFPYHRCFSTDVGVGNDLTLEDWNPMPWDGADTRFESGWCHIAPHEWLYDSDTKLLSLNAYPDWCLTMSPPPAFPDANSRFLILARCDDPANPEIYSQRWEIPLAEEGEELEEEGDGEELEMKRYEGELEEDDAQLKKDGKLRRQGGMGKDKQKSGKSKRDSPRDRPTGRN